MKVLNLVLRLCCVLLIFTGICELQAAEIDATPGRQYRLDKQHGPWMIMVASIHEPPPERKREGMTPQQAAEKLVYELRKKGIPAYTYEVDEVSKDADTTNRMGRKVKTSYRAQRGGIGVIAGNYPSPDDRRATDTLKFIKNFVPASWKNDAAFRPTRLQPNPLSGAFLTLNPMLTPEEIARTKSDPMLVKLNTGNEFSIMENKGKHTLVVATFTGRSQTAVGDQKVKKLLETFKPSANLDDAAMKAWQTAKMLRQGQGNGDLQQQKFDAFVFHDRYASYVTVGSFTRKDDPQIEQLAKLFGAEMKTAYLTKKQFYGAESVTIPGQPLPIVFDPKPKLIDIPRWK